MNSGILTQYTFPERIRTERLRNEDWLLGISGKSLTNKDDNI